MRDLSKLPSITPEMLANAPPPGASGAFRFSLDGVPEHEKAMLTREFFGRAVIRYDIERVRDAPQFEIDVALQMMPGLMMMSGHCARFVQQAHARDGGAGEQRRRRHGCEYAR